MAPKSSNSYTCLALVFVITMGAFSDDCPAPCSCPSKPNGQTVLCSSKEIRVIRFNKLPRRTVEINLSDNQIKFITKDSFPFNRAVKKLDLRGNHIEYIEPGSFDRLPSLVKLYLQVNQLQKIEKGTFNGLRNIKHLNISQNRLLYIHQEAFFGIRNLKRISLKQNQLTTFKRYTFPNSSKIELDGNDLICDCDMKWLVVKSKNRKKGVTFGSKCKYPKSLAGKRLKSLGGQSWKCRKTEFELPGFDILPVHSQVVFQNDSIQLTCTSIWQPRGRLEWQFSTKSLAHTSVRDYGDLESRKNQSVLIIKRADLHHSGDYLCRAVVNNVGEVTKRIKVIVIGWQTKFCPMHRVVTDKGTFSWRNTVGGAMAESSCPFGKSELAQRQCTNVGTWESADTSRCLYENIVTRDFDALSKRVLNESTFNQILLDLNNLTEVYKANITDVKQINIIAKLLAEMGTTKLPLKSLMQRIIKSISDMITGIISVDISNSEMKNRDMIVGLLAILEKFMTDALNREIRDNPKDSPIMLPVTTEVAAFSRSYKPGHPHSLVCNVLFKNRSYPNNGVLGECTDYSNETNIIEGFDAQIVIPRVTFTLSTQFKLNGTKQLTNVTLISYKSADLFPDSDLKGIESKTINSSINSAVIGIRVQVPGMNNADVITSESLVLTFKHFQAGLDPRLLFWSKRNEAKKGRWEINDKCKLVTSKSSYSKFICSELPGTMTYFTVMMEIQKKTQVLATFQLEFVTHVGAGICAFFLLLTFLTYAAFRELRYNRNDAATLMNLCFALIVAVVLFVSGINRIDNQLLCKAFAVLLHYFLLCCLLWVGCGGACMTVLVRKGPDKEEYNPVLKYYLVAWGLPMIICGITLAGNAKNYNITSYCWLTPQASIGAFIIPGGLVVIINMIIFLRLHALVNKKYPEPIANDSPANNTLLNRNSGLAENAKAEFHFPDRGELLDFVKGSLLVMLILCIDCGFVVMIFVNRKGSSRYLYHLFSYGFAISNMILGLAVFIFHCVRREDVNVCWKSLLRGKRFKQNAQLAIENETLLESSSNHVKPTLRSITGVSNAISERNNEHSDVISALSFAQSHFTHDVQSSRPSSIFGPSLGDAKGQGRQGFGKLTLPSYENNKPTQKTSESEATQNPMPPSAPPLPLAGFAAYPPSTLPETVTQFNERPANCTTQNTATPDFTITTVSERTFSDTSNLKSDIRPIGKQSEVMRETVTSDHSSHVDPPQRTNHNARVPLRSIVAPNWKPVRHGGSSAVFYPYVDPSFKSLQSPAPNSLNSVITTASSAQNNHVQPSSQIETLTKVGAFTIPHRSEVIGAPTSTKASSHGNQTDQEHLAKRQSESEAKSQVDTNPQCESKTPSEAPTQEKKVERVRRNRTANRRRRLKSRTKFDDLPVEKCLVYVPLIQEPEPPVPLRNETSV